MITILDLNQVRDLILLATGQTNAEGKIHRNIAENAGVALTYLDGQWQVAVNTLGPVPDALTCESGEDDQEEVSEDKSSQEIKTQAKNAEPVKRKRKRRSKEQIAADNAKAEEAKEEQKPEPEEGKGVQQDKPEPDLTSENDENPPFETETAKAQEPAGEVPQDEGNPFASAASKPVAEPELPENTADVFGNKKVEPTIVDSKVGTGEETKPAPEATANPFANFS